MKMKTEQLKFGEVSYPQLSRLPKGVQFNEQDGHSTNNQISKYSSSFQNGKGILVSAGNSIKVARTNTLKEINRQLRDVKLIWGLQATDELYQEVFD